MDDVLKERIAAVNSRTSIPQLMPHLKLGSNNCPNCGGKLKLSVSEYGVKCWKTSCDWNQGVPLVKLYQNYRGYHERGGFFRALAELEDQLGLSIAPNQILQRQQILQKALIHYQLYLKLPEAKAVYDYLISRGITAEAITKLGIGYAPHNNCLLGTKQFTDNELAEACLVNQYGTEAFAKRIIFPVYNEQNQLVHLQGRLFALDLTKAQQERYPKYKMSQAESAISSGFNFLALGQYLATYAPEELYICEGFPDAISLWQLGLPAVGVFGVEGINKHLARFRPFKTLTFCFDNDRYEASHPTHANKYKSWVRVIPQLVELQQQLPRHQINIFIPPAKLGKDLNDLAQTQLNLPEVITQERQELVSFLTRTWGKRVNKHPVLLPLLRIKNQLEQLQPYVAQLNLDPVQYAALILKHAR